MFLEDLTEFLADITSQYKDLVIVGDFNIHVNSKNDPNGVRLRDTLTAFGLLQHVNFPTHKHGNTLDLLITENSANIIIDSCSPGYFLSDHRAVHAILKRRI